jgi:starch synthase
MFDFKMIAMYREKLTVAPYGFDGQKWDPSRDKHLPRTYSADDMGGKKSCKEALIRHLSLSRYVSIVVCD